MIKEIIGYTTATTVLPKVDSGPNTNGHEYVDLGLPSGTLWAIMNVGASSETEYGNYYMYGMGSKTYDRTDTPYAGTEDPLDSTKDTATVEWGSNWHTPTKTQLDELLANTTHALVTDYQGSGINGYTFTANGQTLFIPAAGGYAYGNLYDLGDWIKIWSSTPSGSPISDYATFLFSNSSTVQVSTNYRTSGISVRPVIG